MQSDHVAGAATAAKPFVGRCGDLAELREAFKQAIAGRGSLVLVAGEPGIGKTRLAEQLALDAAPQGAALLWGSAWEGGGAPPFWPWIQILRQLLRQGSGEHVGALLDEGDPGMADVVRLLPELAGRIPDPDPDPGPEAGKGDRLRAASGVWGPPAEQPLTALPPEQARFRLFDAVARLLTRASETRPQLLVLDDLHWADVPSLLLLRFVAQELYGVRLLLLGAYRDVEAGPGSPIEQLVGALGGACNRMVLRGLDPDEVAQLITLTTGQAPAPSLAASIRERTGGNPLFVREVVRLRAAGVRGRAVPESVRSVLGRRLDLLSPACAELLAVASVFGREPRLDLLQSLAGMAAGETLELLAEAVAARLVEEVPGVPPRWRFTHALVREVLYERLTTGRRLELHRRAGEAIEARFGSDLERHLVELADHFLRDGPESAAKAVDYATRAGHNALKLLALEEAAGHFQRALDTLDLHPEPGAAAAELTRRCELELARAEARMAIGEVSSARAGHERAATLARRLGSAEHLARAAFGLGGEEITFTVDELQIRLLEEALGMLGAQDAVALADLDDPQEPGGEALTGRDIPASPRHDGLRARLLARLARALEYTPEVQRRVKLCDEALGIARRIGDAAALAAVLVDSHRATLAVSPPEEQLAIAAQIVQLAEAAGDRFLALQGRLLRALDLLDLGEIAAMRAEVDAYERGASQPSQPHLVWPGRQLRMTLAIIDGQFDEAKRFNDEALAIGQRASDPLVLTTHLGLDGLLHAVMGNFSDELERRIRAAVPVWPVFLLRIAHTLILADTGRLSEAAEEFERLAACDFAALPHDVNYVISLATASLVAYGLGDAARAAILYERLAPYDGQVVRGSRLAGGCFWAVAHHLGLLAATMGRHDDAVAHFEAALALEARMGALPYLATTRYYHAEALAARGRPGDDQAAARERDAALALLRQLGIRPLFTAVTVADPTAPTTPQLPAPASGVAALLRREGEYWTIGWHGSAFRLRDTVGLAYLARLLATPGQELHALDLAADPGAHGASAAVEESGLGPLLDPPAKAAYRRRLQDLDEALAEAETLGDNQRAALARAEREQLVEQLAAALGLGGRDRPTGASAERARVSVTKALRGAIRRIAEHDPALGEHLHRSVRTGVFCSYDPDPATPVSWTLS